jgi:nucleoside-diphosphate-sugar epimerase
MASRPLVFITGASGLIGFRTLVTTLAAGYPVRAAVRSQEKANAILATPSIRAFGPNVQLSFVLVRNMTSSDAYLEALQGVELILHLASPPALSKSDDFERDIVKPAIDGTLSILNAAAQTLSVKRLVLTSSTVVLATFSEVVLEESPILFTAESTTPTPTGPYGHPFEAYIAGKVAAYNLTREFMSSQPRSFELVILMPVFVIGKNELVTRPEDILLGTNGIALAPVLGFTSPMPMVATTVHVDDVALVHTLALNSTKVPGGSKLILKSGGESPNVWNEANNIVRRTWPERVADGTLPANGSTAVKKNRLTGEETERLLGIRFQGQEAQIRSIVGHYLELVDSVGGKDNVGQFTVQ